MQTIIISALFSWKDGVDAASVGAAHKALAEFARDVPGVRVCWYGLNEENRTSSVYAVYDSPEVLANLYAALETRGRDIMAAESALTQLVPGQTFVQGSKQSLDELEDVIDGWGLLRFHTDTQGDTHVGL
ncbi:MAG: hypothetical protein FJW97_09810 [Actinobacteria bacterium]|nr:hypothetical protein [Actinomycetota bacterium]